MTGLGITRLPDETWRECVERVAKVYGLENECLRDYDEAIACKYSEDHAAWSALYNWDVLEYKP